MTHLQRALLSAGGLAVAALIAPSALADKDDVSKAAALFDPEALERGAKSLREINKSPYAKQVRSESPDWIH